MWREGKWHAGEVRVREGVIKRRQVLPTADIIFFYMGDLCLIDLVYDIPTLSYSKRVS